MTTPTAHDDDGETIHWLQVARQILSGEITPQAARAALNTGDDRRTPDKQPASVQH